MYTGVAGLPKLHREHINKTSGGHKRTQNSTVQMSVKLRVHDSFNIEGDMVKMALMGETTRFQNSWSSGEKEKGKIDL